MDENDDAGYGTLYRSDASGRIFTPSLTYHFYKRQEKLHDFYKIDSFRGTYLASKFVFDHKLVTVITHDRGLTWNTLGNVMNVNMTNSCQHPDDVEENPTPVNDDFSNSEISHHPSDIIVDGESLDQEEDDDRLDEPVMYNTTSTTLESNRTKCSLQISNKFSIKSSTIAFQPTSLKTAPGLIIAHGHVANHLLTSKASVFISKDGGDTWKKSLDGPHSCHIINRGGIIIAVPIEDGSWPNEIKYSLDKGDCWHSIPIDCSECGLFKAGRTTEKIRFTGIVTAPDGSESLAAIYGYGYYSAKWIVGIIDFKRIEQLREACKKDDFEDWHLEKNQCHLGVHVNYRVVKPGSICANNGEIDYYQEVSSCPCKETDFECDFGYTRDLTKGDLCIRNVNIPAVDSQVETSDFIEDLRRLGYQKHPGNKCNGGWQPNIYEQRLLINGKPINKNYLIFFTTWAILMVLSLIIFILRLRGEKNKEKASKYSRFTESNRRPYEALKRLFTMLKPNSPTTSSLITTSKSCTIDGQSSDPEMAGSSGTHKSCDFGRVTFNTRTDGFDNPSSVL